MDESDARVQNPIRRPRTQLTVNHAYTEIRTPSAALVKALKGRTIVDASCDGEGVDDVRLLLDDGTTVLIDTELDQGPRALELAERLGMPEHRWPRLLVKVGGSELWPRSTSE